MGETMISKHISDQDIVSHEETTLNIPKILFDFAVTKAQSAVLDEYFGHTANSKQQYFTAYLLFHTLSQCSSSVLSPAGSQLIESLKSVTVNRLNILKNE